MRKHISRLPAIDPFAPTLLLVGMPNVGKSSFINCITNAKVEVSEIPFSTQNLFLGIGEFKNVRVQVIDSPGLLNRRLEERNTIEMQAITALAHLKSCVLFVFDISETCGYFLDDQVKLFEELMPLFANKPVFVVLNKSDLRKFDQLSPENKALFEKLKAAHPNFQVVENSALDREQTHRVSETAADALLQYRLSQRKDQESLTLKTDEDYYRGVRVATPKHLRNNRQRPAHIPESVLKEREAQEQQEKRKTLRDYEDEFGGPGVFNFPLQEHFILEKPEWKFDLVPEIMNGINLTDYVDPDIERKLEELQREEDERLELERDIKLYEDDPEFQRKKAALDQAKDTLVKKKIDSRLKQKSMVPKPKLSIEQIRERMKRNNVDTSKLDQRIAARLEQEKSKAVLKKLDKMRAAEQGGMAIEGEESEDEKPRFKGRAARVTQRGKWANPKEKTEIFRRKIQKKTLDAGQRGDGDRAIYSKMPKHLFSGKRGIGKTDRR